MKNIILISIFALSTANVTAATMSEEDTLCLGVITWGWEVIGKTEMGYMDKTFNKIKSKYTEKQFSNNFKPIMRKKNELAVGFNQGTISVRKVQEVLGMCQSLAGVK